MEGDGVLVGRAGEEWRWEGEEQSSCSELT